MRVFSRSLFFTLVFSAAFAACSSGGGGGVLSTDDDGGNAGRPAMGDELASDGATPAKPRDAGADRKDGGAKVDSASAPGEGDAEPGSTAPYFVSLTVSAAVTDSTSATVRAVLKDPDGASDVTGGTLRMSGGATIATFVAGQTAGQFSVELTWANLHAAAAINLAEGAVGTRTLEAEFSDSTGQTVVKEASVSLSCGSSDQSACNGKCVATFSDPANCGACGAACPNAPAVGSSTACYDGKCAKWDSCENVTGAVTCGQICAGRGKQCQTLCSGVSTANLVGGVVYVAASCGASFTSNVGCNEYIPTGSYDSVACCCL